MKTRMKGATSCQLSLFAETVMGVKPTWLERSIAAEPLSEGRGVVRSVAGVGDAIKRRGCVVNAFDYDKQQWVSGPEAVALRVRQLRAELEILSSERAPAYMRFIGCATDVEQVREKVRGEIERLERGQS